MFQTPYKHFKMCQSVYTGIIIKTINFYMRVYWVELVVVITL